MDPALWEELLEAEAAADGDRVLEAIIRLAQPGIEIPDVRIVSRFGTIATCRIRARDVIAVRARPEVISLKAPRGLSPGFEPAVGPPGPAGPALLSERPSDVRRSRTLALTGAGVVVACVDWGVDVDSAAFRWPDDPLAAGDHRPGGTRLLSFWDQRDLALGPRPDAYGYGAIHSREEIDRALEDHRPYERLGYHPAIADPRGRGTHGTRTLDIAAGNGRAGGPVGIAPEADLIFAHLADHNTGGQANFGDSVRLLEAVDFISRTAGSQPCVINISAGRICGPKDGTTLVERALDELLAAVPGRFVVNSAGNYFRWRVHACGTIALGEARSLTFITDPADSTLNQLEVWYDGADEFTVRIDPPGTTGSRPLCLGERAELFVEGKVVGRVYHRKHDPNNGDNHIIAYLDPIGCAGNWTVTLEAQRVNCGRFHAWIERDDSCRDCQARFTHDDSNPATTIGSIASSHLPLIVGAYNGHDPARPVATFSSAGPCRDGRTKPDLVAPGQGVLTARSAPIGASRNPGLLVRGNGTSFATPHVTGAVALCFEAAGNRLSAHEIRSLVLGSCDPVLDADLQRRLGQGYLNILRLVADVQQALATPATVRNAREPAVDTQDAFMLLAAAPATAYREYLYRPHGQLARWIGDRYDVVARPGERANRALQRGDVLIEVALGRMGGGRCVTLDEPELEAMGSQLRLPPGQLILRPLLRVEMSESMPVEPVSEATDVGLERLTDQGLPENQITNTLFYARHPTQPTEPAGKKHMGGSGTTLEEQPLEEQFHPTAVPKGVFEGDLLDETEQDRIDYESYEEDEAKVAVSIASIQFAFSGNTDVHAMYLAANSHPLKPGVSLDWWARGVKITDPEWVRGRKDEDNKSAVVTRNKPVRMRVKLECSTPVPVSGTLTATPTLDGSSKYLKEASVAFTYPSSTASHTVDIELASTMPDEVGRFQLNVKWRADGVNVSFAKHVTTHYLYSAYGRPLEPDYDSASTADTGVFTSVADGTLTGTRKRLDKLTQLLGSARRMPAKTEEDLIELLWKLHVGINDTPDSPPYFDADHSRFLTTNGERSGTPVPIGDQWLAWLVTKSPHWNDASCIGHVQLLKTMGAAVGIFVRRTWVYPTTNRFPDKSTPAIGDTDCYALGTFDSSKTQKWSFTHGGWSYQAEPKLMEPDLAWENFEACMLTSQGRFLTGGYPTSSNPKSFTTDRGFKSAKELLRWWDNTKRPRFGKRFMAWVYHNIATDETHFWDVDGNHYDASDYVKIRDTGKELPPP
jgi:subtilisin family serine protease